MEKVNSIQDHIKQVALELLEKKSIIKLTVSDICEAADVSTRTFYNYFLDKHDLVQKLYYDLNAQFWNGVPRSENMKNYVKDFYHFIFQHKAFFKNVLCYSNQNCLQAVIKQKAYDDQREMILRESGMKELTDELSIALWFSIDGSLGFLHSLLEGEFSLDTQSFNVNNTYIYLPEILKEYFL